MTAVGRIGHQISARCLKRGNYLGGRLVSRTLTTTTTPLFHHHRPHNLARFFATRAQSGAWSALSPNEQAAWESLHYTQESWEGRRPAPPWKSWSSLTLEEQSAAKYGLNVHNESEWNQLAPKKQNYSDIPSLESLLNNEYDSDDDSDDSNATSNSTTKALVAQETRALRQQQQQQSTSASANLTKLALNTVKGLAPIVGPLMRSASRHSRGGGAAGLAVAGSFLERLPSIMDASSGVLDITGIDTLLFLDDSGSMQGSNLYQAKAALESLEPRLKAHDRQARFLPTRIVKFGSHPLVLSPSDEDWSLSLVSAAWDGSSGGTYMWKMIQDDIIAKYRPAGGKLRVVVITDGADVLSPPPYRGVRGFDPLMHYLSERGYDIEWHIIVVGNYAGFWGTKELSDQDQRLLDNLCRATGGQFLSVGANGWDEGDSTITEFLEALKDSGYDDDEYDRRRRQANYRLEARKGKAENFGWLPAIQDDDDDNKK